MIRVENLYKNWREFSLKDINLEVKKGEYFVLLGPTGAGKTLLLETIAGFHIPESGKIWIEGKDVTALPPEKRRVGFIYQDYSLFPHLSVKQNIEFGLKLKKSSEGSEKRVNEIMDWLGISHLAHRYPQTLSGGEQQKVAIARAISIEPSLLLLDEPLSALDQRTREYLREELKRVNHELGITMVHVTHDHTEAMLLADRVGVMMNGRIVQVGAPDEIFSRPCSIELANFVGVGNIFNGRIIKNDKGVAEIEIEVKVKAETEIEVNDKDNSKSKDDDRGKRSFTIFASTSLSHGNVKVLIRPEEIILSREKRRDSARNSITTTIDEMEPGGVVIWVNTGCGLVVVITKQSKDELMLKVGDVINLSFKATSVHLLGEGSM